MLVHAIQFKPISINLDYPFSRTTNCNSDIRVDFRCCINMIIVSDGATCYEHTDWAWLIKCRISSCRALWTFFGLLSSQEQMVWTFLQNETTNGRWKQSLIYNITTTGDEKSLVYNIRSQISTVFRYYIHVVHIQMLCRYNCLDTRSKNEFAFQERGSLQMPISHY